MSRSNVDGTWLCWVSRPLILQQLCSMSHFLMSLSSTAPHNFHRKNLNSICSGFHWSTRIINSFSFLKSHNKFHLSDWSIFKLWCHLIRGYHQFVRKVNKDLRKPADLKNRKSITVSTLHVYCECMFVLWMTARHIRYVFFAWPLIMFFNSPFCEVRPNYALICVDHLIFTMS